MNMYFKTGSAIKRGIFPALCLLVITANAFSQPEVIQNEKHPRFGIYASYNPNIHTTNIDTLAGVNVFFPNLSYGSGAGASFSLFYEYPAFGPVYAGLRAGYTILGGGISGHGSTTVGIAGDINTYEGDVESRLTASISDFNIEPYILVNLFREFDVFAGVHVGYILSKNYEYTEHITNSPDAVFPGTNLNSLKTSGKLDYISNVYTSLVIGGGYRIGLTKDKSFSIRPEFSYSTGLANMINKGSESARNEKWVISSMRAGLSIIYSPMP